MANLLGYLVRVISNEIGEDGRMIDNPGKTVKLIPIYDDKLEFDIPYEGEEILGILKSGEIG